MKKVIQWLFKRPVSWLANKVSSSPHRKDVFASLSQIWENIHSGKVDSGIIIPFDLSTAKFIIFSDQHKGTRDYADDFSMAEKNYQTALQYYYDNQFAFINLGDCEELWENKPAATIEKNRMVLLEEAKFLLNDSYYRVFGNHDLAWKFEMQRNTYLKPLFGEKLKVFEGVVLQTSFQDKIFSIFLTHGHQGDKRSDGNAFSTWVVASIWTPIQRFLEININTTSDYIELVDRHNIMMYEWSATQQNLIFVSGHTHKPVFASMDHIDRLTKQLEKARQENNPAHIAEIEKELEKRKKEYEGKKIIKTMVKPSYFNSGCCCFSDGDITGIEIEGDAIRLVKWKRETDHSSRMVLEESALSYIFSLLSQ